MNDPKGTSYISYNRLYLTYFYKDSAKYEVKCRAAASKILVYVKDSFRSALERSVDLHGHSVSGDRESTSFDLFYGRLKIIAPRFHGIMLHLSNAAISPGMLN